MLSADEFIVTILDKEYLIKGLSLGGDPSIVKKLTMEYSVSSDLPLTDDDHELVKGFLSALVKESMNGVNGKDCLKELNPQPELFS